MATLVVTLKNKLKVKTCRKNIRPRKEENLYQFRREVTPPTPIWS